MKDNDPTRRLKEINPEIVKSIVGLDFLEKFGWFLKDGKPRVLYQGDFLGNNSPLSLIYQNTDGETLFPYEETKANFENIFRNEVQGNISDYPMYTGEITLTEHPDMPARLSTYAGKRVRTETISYLLKSRGDKILRKIEFVRYADPETNSPITVRWEGKSLDAFGEIPSSGTDRKIPAYAVPNGSLQK